MLSLIHNIWSKETTQIKLLLRLFSDSLTQLDICITSLHDVYKEKIQSILFQLLLLYLYIGYSLVIKLINSDTHSCIHSLESLPTYTTITTDHSLINTLTLPLFGNAFFMTRPTFAIGKNLSCIEYGTTIHCIYNNVPALYTLQYLFSFLSTLAV